MHALIRLVFVTCAVCCFTASAQAEPASDAIDRVVSVDNPLPAEYVPADLVRAADYGIAVGKPADIDEMKIRLAEDAGSDDAQANMPSRLRALMVRCEDETRERTQLGSGYRSFDKQKIVWWRHRATSQGARPGASEHQAGLAVDIAVGDRFITAQSKTFACFTAHAWEYGFILSYPVGNTYLAESGVFEPWHWRYVGLEAARLMHDFKKENYPAEFLTRLPYFRFLAANQLSEDWGGLGRAVRRLVTLEVRDPRATITFSRHVDELATRVTRDTPTIGPRLAVDYFRWRMNEGVTRDVAGLRQAYAEIDALRASEDRRDRTTVPRVQKFTELLQADVLGARQPR